MSKISTCFLALCAAIGLLTPSQSSAQCTVTNATSCVCGDASNNCDLLPDITISGWAILNYMGGPSEYEQVCVPACNGNDGRLRLTGSTPNIGYGPLTTGSVSMWVCGPDTVTTYPGTCPDGSSPKQLIKQKIYHKNGNTMTFYERWAGTMTYHPGHGHMHVDDWGVFTLRIQTGDPNPLNWPIVGEGAKLGFCIMDYGTCSGYNGHCRDSLNNILTNGDFPNFGLGGGQYNCSPVEQGISSGYTDIYNENLDGMWINIPPGTCNGNYYIVVQVDPNNNFLESNEDNNWAAVPFTLTMQNPPGTGYAQITPSGATDICTNETITLSANAGTNYAWSTGDTTQNITVSAAGTYTVTVTSTCGTASDSETITVSGPTTTPTATGDQVCEGTSATLNASATGIGTTLGWYDAPTGGNLVGTGGTFNTPSLSSTTNYYVEEQETTPGTTYNVGPLNSSIGTGANHTNDTRYLVFDATVPFTLKSVWVNAASAGDRTIQLYDGTGLPVNSVTVNIPAGQSRVTLNLSVPQGNSQRLGLASGSAVDLYRNDAGVSFPYTISNVVSITNSSAGTAYYYFYYDWEIETLAKVCGGPRATATATVDPAPATSISGLNTTYADTDPAVTMTGSPAGGTFSGPGVTGNTFDPAAAGVGGPYTITYSYTDANGCVGSSTFDVTVTSGVSINDEAGNGAELVVFPNPNNGTFTLSFEISGTHQVTFDVTTLAGQVVYSRNLGEISGLYREQISLGSLASGIYSVDLKVDGKVYHQKLSVH